MSDPWIKVYPSDMRADPAIVGMNSSRRYALIQAWDLAKNGPGAIDQLRSSDGSAMTQQELRNLSAVSADETRQLFSDWAARGLCILEDGLVRFPNLAKRQGIDASAAERKRRERERRRHGDVTPKSRQKVTAMSRDVTGESLEEEIEKTPPTPLRDIDAVWAAYLSHHPTAKFPQQRRDLTKRRLKVYDASTLIAAIHGNHNDPYCNGENREGRQYHSYELILRDADHIEKYASMAPTNGNGKTELTAEDFDELERRRDEAAALLEQEIPF